MTKRLKNFLRGAGSIVDVAPAPRAKAQVPRESDAERLQGDFRQIASDRSRAFSTMKPDGKPTRRNQP